MNVNNDKIDKDFNVNKSVNKAWNQLLENTKSKNFFVSRLNAIQNLKNNGTIAEIVK
jgi:hypothetical protein